MGCSSHIQNVRDLRECDRNLSQARRIIYEQQKALDRYIMADSIKAAENVKNERYMEEMLWIEKGRYQLNKMKSAE